MATKKGVIVKVQQWMEKVFGGSDDVEMEDAVDVVDHFSMHFGENTKPFKDLMLNVMQRVSALDPDWNPPQDHRVRASTRIDGGGYGNFRVTMAIGVQRPAFNEGQIPNASHQGLCRGLPGKAIRINARATPNIAAVGGSSWRAHS